MKINTFVFLASQYLWTSVDKVEGVCNADEHHPENNGYFIEGINGFGSIVDPTSDSKRKITNSTWQAGLTYPDGSLKYCTGMFCSEQCRNEGCPDIISGHTCSMIRFCYDADSGSDVWEMPDEMALAKCDFENAKPICNTTEGSDGDCCNFYVEEDADLKLYLFASKAGCDAGQKAAVQIDDFADVGDACYGMGLTTSRIKACTCNYEDREMSTLSEPCHSQFVAGCNHHFPDLGDDTSCCDTKTCVSKHLDYDHPIGKQLEDDRKILCRDDIPGRCLHTVEGTDDCCTKTCSSCGTDVNPFLEWAACDKGNATTSVGECGYGGHGGRFSKYECDFSKCEGGVWDVTGDLYKDWIKTVDEKNYAKTLNIVEAVTEMDLEMLESAIQTAGLVEALSGVGPFTLFAPTNEAFQKIENFEEITADDLKEVLLNHVVPGIFDSTNVESGDTLTTLWGKAITFEETENAAMMNNAALDQELYDIEVSNGVIYVVSDVITFKVATGACYDMNVHQCGCKTDECSKDLCLNKGGVWSEACPDKCDPEVCAQGGETKNILEVAEEKGFFTALLSAVKKAGLEETLSGEGPYTLIAPTDDAFKTSPYDFDNMDKEELKTLLLNHVLDGRYSENNVLGGDKLMTLGGKGLILDISNERAYLNNAELDLENVNINASNGYIHTAYSVLVFEDDDKADVDKGDDKDKDDKNDGSVDDSSAKDEDTSSNGTDNEDETSSSPTKYLNASTVIALLFLICTL